MRPRLSLPEGKSTDGYQEFAKIGPPYGKSAVFLEEVLRQS